MIRISLRVRMGLWYTLFTVSCLTVFGLCLSLYLGHALEASRRATMVKRAARLRAFVESEHLSEPERSLPDILGSFIKASPESDEILIRNPANEQLIFAGGGQPWMQQPPPCLAPCFSEFFLAGHHIRSFTELTNLAGIPTRLTLMGSVDEHFGIVRTVRASLLLFIPFLLCTSITGGYLLSGRALHPVGRITSIASQLSISDLGGRVPVPLTGDELQTLAEAWNDMLARLETSVERNQRFTSDASHDLRTSLAVMLASAQLALRRTRTTEQYAETLRTMAAECEHTLQILEGLLSAARSGFEQHELQLEQLELSQMVRERCTLFAAEAEQHDQKLTLDLEDEVWISGDRSLLHRLIGILVENALKYTPSRGSIVVALHRGSMREPMLEVKDTGPGIAEQDLTRIFGRAYRAVDPGTAAPGSGLGLSIARWIAEAHHARLDVHSQPGKGSTFQVSFARLDQVSRCTSPVGDIAGQCQPRPEWQE